MYGWQLVGDLARAGVFSCVLLLSARTYQGKARLDLAEGVG